MRRGSRAIVIKDNALLVMHRNKLGHEYTVLVGGGVEAEESLEQALLRELQEESGIRVANARLVFIENQGEAYGLQHIFLCDYVSGEPALAVDSEEYAANADGQNMYRPGWLPLSELPDVELRTENLKRAILHALATDFPTKPLDITAS